MTTAITEPKKRIHISWLICLSGAISLFAFFFLHAMDGPALWPEQSGTYVLSDGTLLLDASHAEKGYVMAASSESSEKRLKLRIIKGEMTLTYDLNGEQAYEVFPLQLGSGTYEVALYKCIDGKKYAQEGHVVLEASLEREDGAYLYPNQYVSYSEDSPLVEKAQELCEGSDDRQAFDAVTSFMTSEFIYDFVRSVTVQAGELPNAALCFETRMGICQDLSAVMVAMLRSRGIPSRMMIGYADSNYHAWTETMFDGETVLFDPTAELSAISRPAEYTVERYY